LRGLVLLERVARSAELAEESHHAGMGRLGERIDGHPLARMAQGLVRPIAQSLDQRGEDRQPQGARGLALTHAPLVVAIATGEVESLEELAAKASRRLRQRGEAGGIR